MKSCRTFLLWTLLLAMAVTASVGYAQTEARGLAPPANLTARDHPLDGGETIDLSWALSPDDGTRATGYYIYRSLTPAEIAFENAEERGKLIAAAMAEATTTTEAAADTAGIAGPERGALIRAARRQAAVRAREDADQELAGRLAGPRFTFVGNTLAGVNQLTINNLQLDTAYLFRVEAFAPGGVRSPAITIDTPVAPSRQPFDGGRKYLLIITAIFCGSVIYWILHARSGKEIKVRKIAGLEAIDEAVGRATEMGRSVLYVPGIQDMNEMQTIASMTVLSRVAKTAAEYDAKIEVPTTRALVMTTARETVQAAFLAAGRPDAYNRDLIYYVTDEQFGYVAYLSGMMVREKPAACFYMGAFFAESLILAETGNSIGAIQVAGTAMPAQLPFFVAACDYTLIGEEFFAASAYLSGEPEQLGSLKGQDVGKVLVAVVLLIGVALATLGAITGTAGFTEAADYLKSVILN